MIPKINQGGFEEIKLVERLIKITKSKRTKWGIEQVTKALITGKPRNRRSKHGVRRIYDHRQAGRQPTTMARKLVGSTADLRAERLWMYLESKQATWLTAAAAAAA